MIKDLNETWGNSNFPVSLELLSWEYSVPSSAGNPQGVVNEWIPVESSDIFIAILWKRFGTPPKMKRPQDNQPYLSGTQLEIEKAYECWKTSGRPFFMLYWKEDDLSIHMSAEEIEQFKTVQAYMQKFEVSGEYPALFKRFKKVNFKRMLKRELAQVIGKLSRLPENANDAMAMMASVSPGRLTASREANSEDFLLGDIELRAWLKKVQLKDNPFRYQYAEDDGSLPMYFTRFPDLNAVTTGDMTLERKSWFFFGNDGSGKTALRKFIAAYGRPQKKDSEMVCIEYDQVKFEHLLSNTGDLSEFQVTFVRSVFDSLADYVGGVIHNSQPPGSLRGNLTSLSVALRENGINWVLCLIDPGKAEFEWRGSQVPTSTLIAPLFSLAEVGGYGFRYFLPKIMKDALEPIFSRFPFNYIRTMEIKWDEKALGEMLSKRMTLLSDDQTAPYRSLGELCDDEQNLSTLIDSEITSLAQSNPRAAIWLANHLIEQHCDHYPVPPRITVETWNNVKRGWWSNGESWILGRSVSSAFRVLSDRIYCQNWEIILPERSDRLLKALILASGHFCSKQELIKAGWKGEKNLAGISEKALSEAMRRMKKELKKELKLKGFAKFDGVKSVRGRGYRLLQPAASHSMQEGDYEQ